MEEETELEYLSLKGGFMYTSESNEEEIWERIVNERQITDALLRIHPSLHILTPAPKRELLLIIMKETNMSIDGKGYKKQHYPPNCHMHQTHGQGILHI